MGYCKTTKTSEYKRINILEQGSSKFMFKHDNILMFKQKICRKSEMKIKKVFIRSLHIKSSL